MRHRRLGPGVSVSPLALATAHFGTHVDEASAFAVLDRFVEAGGTFIDASAHGERPGPAEGVVRRWLRDRGGRDRLVIATRITAASAASVHAQARERLRRLGTGHIDLLYTDAPAGDTEPAWRACGELVHAGIVRLLGARGHTLAGIRSAGPPGYATVHRRWTYLIPAAATPGHAGDDLLAYVRDTAEVTLLAYSPLLAGAYSRADRPVPPQFLHPGTPRRLAVLAEVADRIAATRNQVVLAWLLGAAPRALPVIAAGSVAKIDECVRALDVVLDAPMRTRLDQAGR